MRSVARIAVGTALGIILAGILAALVFLVVVRWVVHDASKPAKPANPVTSVPRAQDTDGDGKPDVRDPDPFSANSGSSRPAKRTKRHRATRSKPTSTTTACDANIGIKAATTSCPFAQNVFLAYWMDQDSPGVFADSPGIPAYSAAADEMFTVDCSGDPVVCRASDGGYVTFPMAAVAAYNMADAKRYAASHDTGGITPGDTETSPPSTDQPPSSGSGDCDPNYEGACLDPNSSDYDCEGGSGDGPDYTGTVAVVGDDPYDLDRDGDGIACDM